MSNGRHDFPNLPWTDTYDFRNIPIRKHAANGYSVDHVKNFRAEIIELIHLFKSQIG
ncbi:hypothetical protein CpPA04_0094 [Corynebacterium pseudotuberculosis]|nr:hypothetical protein CpPA04_0094 [Corynebacterium pseudotuberculosis]